MRALLLALLVSLVAAAPAAADSLVYTKDGNVWSARPDGSQQRQLTRDGTPRDPYGSPSQADDGTILAVRGSRFYKFDRDGRQIGAPMDSVLTRKPGAIGAVGPFDARISPDGRHFASWLGIMGGYYDWATSTYYSDPESAIVYQSAQDGTPVGETMFYEEPSWMADSQHLLMSDSMNALTPQVMTAEMGADHNHLHGWFHDSDTFDDPGGWKPVGAAELTRAGDRLAALRGGATLGHGGLARGTGNGIVIYDVSGFDAPPRPWPCWLTDDQGAELSPPSWAPDGGALAWATVDGIWTATTRGGCAGMQVKLVVPGGREPDWGPADPSAAPPGGPAVPAPPAQPGTPAAVRVSVARSVRRSELVRRGLAVTASCPGSCSVSAVARRGGRVAGRGRAEGAGNVRAVVRLSRAGRRAVARGRGSLAVRVEVRAAGAAPRAFTRAVAIRR